MKNKYLTKYLEQSLRACQLKQLRMLEEVDKVCSKHNIQYWLDGGTLLGAVRHKGFIPWDDDIDLGMTLEDVKRFEKIAPNELPEWLFLQTKTTDPETNKPIIKVRDLNSFMVEPNDDFSESYQKGLFLDIFPFIDYPLVPRLWVKKIVKNISVSYSILHTKHYYSFRSVANFFWFGFKYVFLHSLWFIIKCIFPKKKYMSNILHNNGYGIVHRKDSIFPLKKIIFEGKSFSAPHNPDAYLKDLYKNYMDIPPVNKRQVHAVYMNLELVNYETSID